MPYATIEIRLRVGRPSDVARRAPAAAGFRPGRVPGPTVPPEDTVPATRGVATGESAPSRWSGRP